ncbi:hypothetical protein ScPMuIL_002348 [Solemya velum]
MGLISDGLEIIVSLYNGYFVVIGIDCQSTVYVRDGDDMRLTCTGGDGVQVKWYINDGTTSVLLTINAVINPNEPDFTARLSVTYNEPPGQYVLVKTSFNKNTDSGVYSCQVGLKNPPYPTFSVRSPDPPTSITTKIDGVGADSVVWVDGQTKTVTCEAIGGSPTPTVSLIRDGTELVSGTGSVSRDVTLTRSMNPVVIQCEAINVAIDNPITDQTTMNVLYPPSGGPDITGYTGQVLTERDPPTTVTLTCTVGEASPVPTLTWNCPAGSSSTGPITRVISINRNMDGVTCTCSGSQSVTGWTGADSVTFTVHYGPTTASINGSRDVYADNNQELTLTCEPDRVRPGATYTWRKNGVKINGATQKTLTFTPTSTDNMAVMSCVASNSQYPDITATGSATLNVRYKPYITEVIVRSDGRNNPPSIIEGRKMTLTCDSRGNPTPSYTFSQGTGPTPVISTERTYTDRNVTRADSGHYTCTASNTHGIDSRTVNVIVNYAPDVEITSSDLEVDSQSSINLSCKASGNPSQYTFHQWNHYGPHGDMNIRALDGIDGLNNSNLILPSPVSYQDSGIYECVVDNEIPNLQGHLVQRGRIEVTVLSPPTIPQHEAHASTALDERTTLKVDFYSVPDYTAVDWFYSVDAQGGTPRKIYVTEGDQAVEKKVIQMLYHGKIVDVMGYETTLTFDKITDNQFRVYHIEVANVYGKTTSSIELRKSTVPCTPGDGQLVSEELTQSSAKVGWPASCNGGKSQTFIVEYKKAEADAWILFQEIDGKNDSNTYTIQIAGLAPITVYDIRIRAENINGQSDYAHISLKTSQFTQEAPICLEPTDAAIVGSVLGTVLVLVLLVVWVILWRKGLLHKETSQCCEDQTKEPAAVYQNQVFQEETIDARDGVYQSIGPTENPNMHYQRIDRDTINEHIDAGPTQ